MGKKRGYFFVLDAMIGLFVLVIGVFLVASLYVDAPQQTQVGLLADDLLNFLSTKKIKDLNNPYAGIGGQLWQNGTISDGENTLLMQIGYFYAKNDFGTSEKFIANVSKDVMPSQFRYEVWLNNEILYPQIQTAEHLKSKEDTEILLTSKKITFGILNKTNGQIWGPYKAEVFVWQR